MRRKKNRARLESGLRRLGHGPSRISGPFFLTECCFLRDVNVDELGLLCNVMEFELGTGIEILVNRGS